MAYQPVNLQPGINVQQTPTLNETSWADCAFIRFKDGMPQKLGGWTYFYNFSFGSPIRALHAWQDLNQQDYLAVGAEQSLQILTNNSPAVITPQTKTSTVTPNFSTTSGSPTVTVVDASTNATIYDAVFFATPISVGGLILQGTYPVTSDLGSSSYTITASSDATSTVANGGDLAVFDTTSGSSQVEVTFPGHGLSVGNTVGYLVPTTVGGLTIEGTYTVFSVVDANTYVITASSAATSTATETMNGGDAQLDYFVGLGPLPSGSGWGIGPWGIGGWGTGSTSSFVPGTPVVTTNWTLDNWGEILLSCPADGAIYTWRPRSGFLTATVIPQAPTVNGGMFVAMPQQMIVAWASSWDGIQDPLLIRWCDVANYSVWIADSTNQAGSFRIPRGSRIVGALQAPQRGLVWTDLALWSMTYVDSQYVWGFDQLATGCGLVGRHGAVVLTDTVYWMNAGNFFRITPGGAPQQLNCSVWDKVFQNIDPDNYDKVIAAANSNFNEVMWFYPSLDGGGEVDTYVKVNVTDGTWDYGPLGRTAWIDQSVLGNPIGADASGYVYQHEEGYDAAGVPMQPYIQSGWFKITEGDPLVFVDMLLPDFKWGIYPGTGDAQVLVTVDVVNYPADTPTSYGPFTMTEAVTFINMRARGRMARITITSEDLGSFWRLGDLRYRAAQAGRR